VRPRFTVGDYVVCRAYVKFTHRTDGRRIAERTEREVRGWIVGMSVRFEGIAHAGGNWASSPYGEPEYERAYLEVEKTFRVWKVAAALMNSPAEVLDEDMPEAPSSPPGPCPMRVVSIDERARERMRTESAHWPRDRRGRFVKDAPARTPAAPTSDQAKGRDV